MRAVLDTNVLVRAHGHGLTRAAALLSELLRRGHELVISNEILSEVTRVLRYPHFQALCGLSDSELLQYTQFLQSVSHVVVLSAQYRARLRDAADLMVLQTADEGEADFLCTQDADFDEPEVRAYCSERGIQVGGEAELLRLMKGN